MFDCKSTLLKTIPVFGSEGFTDTLDNFPLWSPTPLKVAVFFKVFWLNNDTKRLLMSSEKNWKQQILR